MRGQRLASVVSAWLLQPRLQWLRYLGVFVRLLWDAQALYCVSAVFVRIARALLPIATLWVAQLIVDDVIRFARADASDHVHLWRLIGLELGLVILSELMLRTSMVVEGLLGDLFSIQASLRILKHAARLDLEQFDSPTCQDALDRAIQQTAGERLGLIGKLLDLAQDLATTLSLAIVIASFNLWLGLLLLVAVLPNLIGHTQIAALEYSLLSTWTPERRRLGYLRFLGANVRSAKETRSLGLDSWIITRYRTTATRYYEAHRQLAVRRGWIAVLLAAIGSVGYYASYVIVVRAALAGTISIGQLTLLSGAFLRSRDLIQRLLVNVASLYEHSLYLRDLFLFLELQPRQGSSIGGRKMPDRLRRGLTFQNVGFRYEGAERWALRDLNFTLHPGECVAVVGENGSGKSTLIKLLTRLYEPTEGRILLDGTDVREYDLASFRAAITAMFQDFMCYSMAFDENVALGDVQTMTDYLDSVATAGSQASGANAQVAPASLRAAVEEAGATTVLARLPGGYRQMLGRGFEGGLDLSGGEWQRVALARTSMRAKRAVMLVLDEPTAALDARAEHVIFQRIRALATERLSIIVSHRFSTARLADRIIVLTGGRVTEMGTHQELLASPHTYAELFELQASGYH